MKIAKISEWSHRIKKDCFEKRECNYLDADVKIEEFAHRIWFVVDANGNPWPNLKLSFKPFTDTSILKMPDNKVFTLFVNGNNLQTFKYLYFTVELGFLFVSFRFLALKNHIKGFLLFLCSF